ncbi:MAG TPA: glutamine-hydrolyzing carbamoyl-phosphate synthase small subunit [Candidatus Poseidoniales archaeon]|nr:glutamine-hydrolyzing carbamoyl-phosphate synthase small subunit [Candidatus Poseidoniales archaeon]
MLEGLNDSSTTLNASLLSTVMQDPVPADLAPVARPEVPGVLLLEDGSRWEGLLFGACGRGSGELVFTTNMTGYQESLTDPSFAGQVLLFTYPMLGNYGVLPSSSESAAIGPSAVVCRHHMPRPSHRDAVGSVDAWLTHHGVTGIHGVDTRALTERIREQGTILCVVGPLGEEEELTRSLDSLTDPSLADLVASVSTKEVRYIASSIPDAPRIALVDCGVKRSIVASLAERFEVVWSPPTIGHDKLVEDHGVSGIFVSNGPGDPSHEGMASMATQTVADAIASGTPMAGICLGHQLLGLACGLHTYKMRFGHRGANQPVRDEKSGRVAITSQNHGFAVEDPELGIIDPHPSGLTGGGQSLIDARAIVRHRNANDRTVEGLDLLDHDAFSVQFHPEAAPGPRDARPQFQRFARIIDERRSES